MEISKIPKRLFGIAASATLLLSLVSACASGADEPPQDRLEISPPSRQADQAVQLTDEGTEPSEEAPPHSARSDSPEYRTGSDPLCMELDGSSCEIISDGTAISCLWKDGRTEEIHQIRLDGFTSLYFFPAKVEGLASPVLVVSDASGVFWGSIYIYRYNESDGKWEALLINSRDVPAQFGEYISSPWIAANPRCNQDGYLELAEFADIGLSRRLFLVHHVIYDEEDGSIWLDQHTPYESEAGIPSWWYSIK